MTWLRFVGFFIENLSVSKIEPEFITTIFAGKSDNFAFWQSIFLNFELFPAIRTFDNHLAPYFRTIKIR